MKNTGIFYGSSTGNGHAIVELLQDEMGISPDNIHDISLVRSVKLNAYEHLIFGISTWENGSMQEDFRTFLSRIRKLNLTGKRVAIFGLGDQVNYADHFADALGILYDILLPTGCKFCGAWPAGDYNFRQSKACRDGRFVGLVLDEDTQSHFTTWRVKHWAEQLRYEFPHASALDYRAHEDTMA